MSSHTHSVDVRAPVRVAYNQWTQFEEFPRFMAGVESITQLDDRNLHWKVDLDGVQREFDTEITEQTPDHRIAWKTTQGSHHAGVVTFHRLDADNTRVTVQMEYDPDGFIEHVGDKLGFVSRRLEDDMARFGELIEDRDAASGAWRGVISQD